MNDLERVNSAIGRNLAALRTARQLTLERLAAASGVSKGMVVQIEQGRTNPSIGTLCRLANALGVPVNRLVEPQISPVLNKTRLEDATPLWRGPSGGVGRLITGFDSPTFLEFWEWRLNPGEAHDGIAHPVGTRELLFVRQGILTLTAGQLSEQLAADHALVFTADIPHRYANESDDPLAFLMVVTEPGTRMSTGVI